MGFDWKSATKGSGGGSGMFLRLKNDGDQAKIVVHGNPANRYVEWVDGKAEDRSGPGPNVKAQVLLPVYDVDQRCPRLLEMSGPTFRDLASLVSDEEVGGEDQVYRLTRRGTGMETRWTWTRLREAPTDILAAAKREEPIDPMEYGGKPMGLAPSSSGGTTTRTRAMPADEAEAQPETDTDLPF